MLFSQVKGMACPNLGFRWIFTETHRSAFEVLHPYLRRFLTVLEGQGFFVPAAIES